MKLRNRYAIFGVSGCGKTTFINKKIIPAFDKSSVFAFDMKQSLDVIQENRVPSLQVLTEKAKTSSNSVFIVDDGTGVLRAGNSNIINDFLYLLNTARHENNYFIFVFHDIKFFPQAFECAIDCYCFFEIKAKIEHMELKFSVFDDKENKAAICKKQPYKPIIIYK